MYAGMEEGGLIEMHNIYPCPLDQPTEAGAGIEPATQEEEPSRGFYRYYGRCQSVPT